LGDHSLRLQVRCAGAFVGFSAGNQPDNREANLGSENPFGASPTTEDDQDTKLAEELVALTSSSDDTGASPMLDANMSSARSIASTSTAASAKPYISKVGVLPSSLPAYHKVFMEREKAKAAGLDIADTTPASLEVPQQPRSQAEQEETIRRLKPHSRSQLRLDEANKRPQGLTPVNPPKKNKPTRWQFGIRSRNAPWDALVCIYKALSKLGAEWIVDEEYDRVHSGDEDGDDYDGSPRSRKHGSTSSIDPTKIYRLPADPWHMKIRWTTDSVLPFRLLLSGH